MVKKKNIRLSFLLVAAVFTLSIISYNLLVRSPPKASAAVTVDTSTAANSTGSTNTRKVFYDTTTSLYWAFYYNGTAIAYANSSNGIAWTNRGTTGAAVNDFSVWLDSGNVYMVYASSGVQVQKGTLGATSITWSGLTAANASGSDVNIALSSTGIIWITYQYTTGSGATLNSHIGARSSTSANNTTSWSVVSILISGGSTSAISASPAVVPMSTSGNMLFVVDAADVLSNTTDIESILYTASGSTFGSPITVANAAVCNLPGGILNLVAGASDTAGLAYQDAACTGNIIFSQYSSAAWASAVTLDSSASNASPSISIDGVGNLYVFWIKANTIKYKKGVSPFGSGNWDVAATSFFSTGTNTNVSTSYSQGGGNIQVIWANGSASPYNIDYQALSFNSAPAAPTLSSPANGATGVSVTPAFQLKTTDADNDYLRYKINICSDAACANVFYTADQTNSQTGWSGQDQQISTAYTGSSTLGSSTTATYTYGGPALNNGTTYYWRGYAIDPGGNAVFSSASSIQSFTTTGIPNQVQIRGGSTIRGGSVVK